MRRGSVGSTLGTSRLRTQRVPRRLNRLRAAGGDLVASQASRRASPERTGATGIGSESAPYVVSTSQRSW